MRLTETIVVSWLIVSCLEGCIESYYPKIDDEQPVIVIDGTLTDREGYHYIRVSRSIKYAYHRNIPVQGCVVEIIDNESNIINFYESESGLYEQWINQEYLETGKKYKLRVTADGTVYESGYETMLPCPPVGNVYYEIEKRETTDPGNDIYGIQFYTDIVAPEGYPENYRWELEETWEYHAKYSIRWWVERGEDVIIIHDTGTYTDSLYYCWSSGSIQELNIVTIKHVSGDSLNRIPLRFVSNETNRLTVKYSLLIKQYSLSDSTYDYWNQLKKQNEETGGLYETQPAQIRGNISNIKDAQEAVLGYFNVTSVSEKRIFVDETFSFFPPDYNCRLVPINDENRWRLGWEPKYLVLVDRTPWGAPIFNTAKEECFDCRILGGTTQKPDFWE